MSLTATRVKRRPSRAVTTALSLGVLLAWALLRLVVFDRDFFALTFALPLLVCVWTRDRLVLWFLAAAGIMLAFLEVFRGHAALHLPVETQWATLGAAVSNIVLAAVAVHLIITMADRLELNLRLASDSQEQARAHALELAAQNEELEAQRSELQRQAVELQAQADEIGALNAELACRERTLRRVLEATRSLSAEQEILDTICSASLEMLGGQADLAMVLEAEAETLAVRAVARRQGPVATSEGPLDGSLTRPVLERLRATVAQGSPSFHNLLWTGPEGNGTYRSVLASPLNPAGQGSGFVAVFAMAPDAWSSDQFRVVDWLASECSLALEAARLQAQTRRHASLIDLSLDGIFVRRLDGTITLWGRGAEILFGHTRDEASGRAAQTLLRTRFPRPLEEINAELEATGSWSGELRHQTKSGHEVIVESRWQAQRDAHGAIVELLESNFDITERSRMEAALAAAHDHAVWLARFPDENPNPVARASSDGRVLYRNAACARLPGFECEIGDSLPRPLLDMVLHAMATGHQADHEVEIAARSYAVAVAPFPSEGYANLYGRDITERRRSEVERAELVARLEAAVRDATQSQAQLEAVFQTMQDGLMVFDPAGNVVLVNDAEARINGYPDATAMKKDLAFFSQVYELLEDGSGPLPPQEWPASRVLRGETLANVELRGRRKDTGREWFFSFSGAPVRDEAGRPVLAVTITRDITERRLKDEELRRSEATLRGILNATTESIWLFSQEGDILMANEMALSRFSKTEREVLGQPMSTYLSSELARSRLARLREAVETRQPVEFEDERCGIHFHHSFYPVIGGDGQVLAVACFSGDITKRRRTEAALQASLREKEVLLKEIHHRVKNNLQIIASLLNLQMESIRSDEDRLLLLDSQQRIRALALIHEKLYGSKDLSRIPFREYATDLSTALLQGFQAGNVAVAFNLEDVHLQVGMAIPLALILNELLSNALKHAFPDGRRGRVTVGLRTREDAQYELTVEDDGVGFPDGVVVEDSPTLGLQIVSILTSQLAGQIALTGAPGSHFSIVFPDVA